MPHGTRHGHRIPCLGQRRVHQDPVHALLHGRELFLPYAMSDSATSIALIHLDELLHTLGSTRRGAGNGAK